MKTGNDKYSDARIVVQSARIPRSLLLIFESQTIEKVQDWRSVPLDLIGQVKVEGRSKFVPAKSSTDDRCIILRNFRHAKECPSLPYG